MTAAEADAHATVFEAVFPLLAETPGIYSAWKAIVNGLAILGKQGHDARLVAVCHAYGVPRLLTFNHTHFARLSAFPPGIVVIDPAGV
jgi:predicted nucleic acid-binding protein